MTLLVANNFVKMKAMRYNGEWKDVRYKTLYDNKEKKIITQQG